MKNEWQERMRSGQSRWGFFESEVLVDDPELASLLAETFREAINGVYIEAEKQLKAAGFSKYGYIPENLVLERWFEVRDGKLFLCGKFRYENSAVSAAKEE
jgi:hypothetical protein